jgi:LysR family transcriptional regulator for bpeEF and oprC
MDRLQAMQVFVKIVEMNGFSRAADALNIPHASATTIIKNLEAHLHVRLMQRTTRRLNLTPEGAEYYERCVNILAEIEQTEASLANTGKGPRGKLRIDMLGSIGRLIVMPQLHDFRKRYPDIRLMVGLGDKPVDLIQEGVDVAIRVGTLEDSSLVPRRLGVLQTLTVASPEYLRRFGEPHSMEDLQRHQAVHYFSSRTSRAIDFNFVVDKQAIKAPMEATISVNDAEAYVMAGLSGAGIIQSPRFLLQPHLESGALIEVLPQWKPLPMPISAVYPHNRHLAPKVRAFLDWAAQLFEKCPLMQIDNDAASQCLPTKQKHHVAQERSGAPAAPTSPEVVV